MKRTPALMLIMLLIGTMICFCSSASAEAVTGTTREATTFRVTANKNGYITLTSSLGTAMVAQHNWIGNYEQDGKERHYGFYQVMIQQKDGPFNQSFIWAPSATKNKSEVNTCIQLQLNFPYAGTYTIKIDPLSSSRAASYWKVDYIRYWVDQAQWVVSIENNCTAKKPMAYDTIEIEYLTMNGDRVRDPETKRINASQTVYPGSVPSGYICRSNSQYVTFNQFDGASPKKITFRYTSTIVSVTNVYISSSGDPVKDTKKYSFNKSGYALSLPKSGFYCITKPVWIVYSESGVSVSEVTYVHVYGLNDEKYNSLHDAYYGSNGSYWPPQPSGKLLPYSVSDLPDIPDSMDKNFIEFLVANADSNPPTAVPVTTPTAPPSARKPGDVNGDGKISISDITRLIGYYNNPGSVSINQANADVNGDGRISISDITRLIGIYNNNYK